MPLGAKAKKAALQLEKFERFKRSNKMSLPDYTMELEELLCCLEKYEIKLPPVVLVYQYLNNANLKEVQGIIFRSTISD